MLQVSGLRAGYGGGTVLHGVDLTVPAGTVHGVLGHNGAGKTTLLAAIAGLLRPDAGSVLLGGAPVAGRPVHRIARAGVRLVPQGRRVFASLTVAEHFRAAYRPTRGRPAAWPPDRVRALLPALDRRWTHRGGQLSGGEQQLLALARALLGQPRVLLLDEPTEGLAPILVAEVTELVRELAADGLTMLLTGPQQRLVTAVADQVSVLRTGRVVLRCTGADARADPAPLHDALSVADTEEPVDGRR